MSISSKLSMFKKAVTTIATLAVVASTFAAVAPASATPASNAGAVVKKNWILNSSSPSNSYTSDTTLRAYAPAGNSQFSGYVNVDFGKTFAQAHVGDVIRIDWHKNFAGTGDWAPLQQIDPTVKQPSKYTAAQSAGPCYSPCWYHYGDVTFSTTTDNTDPATDSTLFTVPSSVSNMVTGQYLEIAAGLTGYSGVTPGVYSIAPTFYDKTTHTSIALSSTRSDSNVTASWNSSASGNGAYNGTIPAKATLVQSMVTCVNAPVLGHHLTVTSYAGGVAQPSNQYGSFPYVKGSSSAAGYSWPYTISSADASSGLRIPASSLIDNSSGTSDIQTPSTDEIVTDTDSSTQVEGTCAAAAPAKPTFTLSSLTNGTLSWTKIASDIAVNQYSRSVSYNYNIYKASDLATVVATGNLIYPTLGQDGQTYTANLYSLADPSGTSVQLLGNTNYVVKMTATNSNDGVASPESIASDPAIISAPAAPTGVTFTLNNLSTASFTWTKVPTDVLVNGYPSVHYNYKIYRASDLTTPVVDNGSFMMAPTLGQDGQTYTASNVTFQGGPPNYMPVNLTANTDYVAKIFATNSANLTSDGSAPSAPSQVTGPATPNTPVITSVTVTTITATLAVRSGETSFGYSAMAYNTADLTTPVGQGQCMALTQGSLSYTCSIRSMGGMMSASGFMAPNLYVVKVTATNNTNQISSLASAASNSMIGGFPGVTLGTPSNGTGNGDAKTLTSSFPWISDSFSSATSPLAAPKGVIIPDGLGNFYSLSQQASVVGSPGESFDLRKIKSDFTGFDSTFGTAGKVTAVIAHGTDSTNTFVQMPTAIMFANSTKVALLDEVSNCPVPQLNQQYIPCNTPSSPTLREATLGSAFGNAVDISGKANTFCTANVDSGFGSITYAGIGNAPGFQAMARPVVSVSCGGHLTVAPYSSYTQSFLASIATDGTLTLLLKLNSVNSTQNRIVSWNVSAIPTATNATDVAAVVFMTRALYTSGNGPSVTDHYARAVVRVKVNGTVSSEVDPGYSTSTTSEPALSVAPVNDGTTVYAVENVSGVNKLLALPVADGPFGAPTTMVLDNPVFQGATQLGFPGSSVPNVNGKIAFIRTDSTMSSQSTGPMNYDIATNTSATGEMLSYAYAGNALNLKVIDAAGNMDLLYTPAISLGNSPTHTVVQWKNVRAIVPVPTPTVASPVVNISLNAGGTNLTITGTNLDASSAAKRVTGVQFSQQGSAGTTVTTITKSATSIVVRIPSSTTAGISVAPTAGAPVMVAVSLVLGNGSTVSAGSVTYVGATALPQTFTMTLSSAPALTTDADRTVSLSAVTVNPVQAAAPGVPVLSTGNASVCTIVDGKVHFVSNGNCVVTATKAATDWLAAGTQTATILVTKGDSVTAGFADGDTPAETATIDGAISPVITLASGRTDYTVTVADADAAICSYDSVDTKMFWFKSGNHTCHVTIATAGTVNGWAPVSYNWNISVLPPIGSADSPLLVRNDNVLVKLPGLAITWNQKQNQVFFTFRTRRVGPIQAEMSFGSNPAANGAPYTCDINFGTLKKTPLPTTGGGLLSIKSQAFCTDTVNLSGAKMSAAEKAAQTAAYNAFIALVATNSTAHNATPISIKYRRIVHIAPTYGLVYPGASQDLTTYAWSAPTYANLYYLALDTVMASLPVGVPALVSATADGAVVPSISLESKRTDYSITSSDTAKCSVTDDGRIWFKQAGVNCVLTVATGSNAVWAAKSLTWTIPMVAAAASTADNAVTLPSNGTQVNLGPLGIVWNQAGNSVIAKLSSKNAGLVRVRMQFTDLTNTVHTCVSAIFGAKKIAGASDAVKTQSSPALCAGADLVAFKALVASKKTASAVIPVTLSYQFDQYDPASGAEITGQVPNTDTKPWSANFFAKLNYRATAN